MIRFLLAALVVLGPIAHAQVVSPVIPDGLGVNIHFTDPRPGEMKQIADAGFKFVRMDFDWNAIEVEKGKYDFSAYDRLVNACDEHGVRILFILDYVNKHYDDARSPDTEEGRAAFARWAAAGAQHFKGRTILWEMYNEPNTFPFWRPKPNADDYVKLALVTAKAIRDVAPDEIQIGPATSGIDLPFLEACFKGGLLDYWSAVSVHPYRQQDPETVADDYRRLRLLIRKYAPKDKVIPILSGEWGYSSVWSGFDEDRQGKMLPRQWLTNLANDVPLSIWYDWRDDGPDPKEPEHHFGTVKLDHTPKPAYVAARTLTSQLDGYTFNKRLAFESPQDHVLLFTKDDQFKLVAWTSADQFRRVQVPGSAKRYTVVSHLGEELPELASADSVITIPLTDTPQYITPDGPDNCLAAVAWVGRAALEIHLDREQALAGFLVAGLASPLRPIEITTYRSLVAEQKKLRAQLAEQGAPSPDVHSSVIAPGWYKSPIGPAPHRLLIWQDLVTERDSLPFYQETYAVITDPLSIHVFPRIRDVVPIRIENPAGTAWRGQVLFSTAGSPGTIEPIELLPQKTYLNLLRNAPPAEKDGSYMVSLGLMDETGRMILRTTPRRGLPVNIDREQLTLAAEGDPQVASEQSFKPVAAPPGLPVDAVPSIRITYRFDPGWKYVCLKPREHLLIDGKPTHLGVWVKGDGSGNIPRLRLLDSTGQTFQPDGEKLTDTDWRYVEFPLDGTRAGHWGGANDGKVHYPIRLETLLLIDSAARQKTEGTVYISSPTLIYPHE